MSQILVSPEELRQLSSMVAGQSEAVDTQVNQLRTNLSDLQSKFQGNAAQTFQQRFEEWHGSAANLLQALNSLGQFLSQAADTVEEADRNLAAGLNGA